MFLRVILTSAAIVLLCLVSVGSRKVKRHRSPYGLDGMSSSDTTNCTEFSKFGRFNPYSVLNEKWFVFYYWAPTRPLTTFVFAYPTANHTKRLKRILDGNCVLPVMWSARLLLMEENNKFLSLLVERGDRGEYWLYPVLKVKGGKKISPRDIRIKQTGDNRILGIMDCDLETTLVMTRINDVPPKRSLQEVASRLGYRGRRGKSYLYQGHEWGPMPEADESLFWDHRPKNRSSKEPSKEVSERNNKEVELQPINNPEDSQEKIEDEESKAVLLTFNEDELGCCRMEPELWNDSKPNPTNDPDHLTKEELNNLEDTDTNNTLTIDVPGSAQIDIQGNNLEKESQNTPENIRLKQETQNTQENNEQNINKSSQMGMPLQEPGNHNSHTEEQMTNTQKENEDCEVCFKSTVGAIISTNDAYRPENSRTITDFEKNEPTRAEIPRAEIRRAEIPRAELQRAKVSVGSQVPEQDLKNSSGVIILSPQTLDDLKS